MTIQVTMTTRERSLTSGVDYRYSIAELGGDVIRVVICGDVVALPDEGWAGAGYGSAVTVGWLLERTPRLPGSKSKRVVLATCICRALDDQAGLYKANKLRGFF